MAGPRVRADLNRIERYQGRAKAAKIVDCMLLGGGKKVSSVAGLCPQELESTQAMREGFFLYGGVS